VCSSPNICGVIKSGSMRLVESYITETTNMNYHIFEIILLESVSMKYAQKTGTFSSPVFQDK